jgi:hypothetical protein
MTGLSTGREVVVMKMSDAAARLIESHTPALLITESLVEYNVLKSGILEALMPRDAVEAELALCYIDCCWSISRGRRVAAGIVNVTYVVALRTMLKEYASGGVEELEGLTPDQIARAYFRDPRVRALAVAHLRSIGIEESTIAAQAFAMRAREISIVDEGQARAQIQALALLREFDRRRQAEPVALNATASPDMSKDVSAPQVELHQ